MRATLAASVALISRSGGCQKHDAKALQRGVETYDGHAVGSRLPTERRFCVCFKMSGSVEEFWDACPVEQEHLDSYAIWVFL